jgi:hypothetical protein
VSAGVLFVAMLAAIEAGYRLGRRTKWQTPESSRSHINAMQASLLGVVTDARIRCLITL